MTMKVEVSYVILQNSLELDVDGVCYHLATILDVLHDHVSCWCHGVGGQKPDDSRVLPSVRNLHGARHYDVAPAQNLVADVLQTFRGIHLDLNVFIHL